MSVVIDTIEKTFTYTCDYCDPGRERPIVVPVDEGLPETWGRRNDDVTERHVCPDCCEANGWEGQSFASAFDEPESTLADVGVRVSHEIATDPFGGPAVGHVVLNVRLELGGRSAVEGQIYLDEHLTRELVAEIGQAALGCVEALKSHDH